MGELLDLLIVLVLLLNFVLLGSPRLKALIDGSALQGVVLGLLALLAHGGPGPSALVLGAAVVALKGVLIPRLLHRAMREVTIRREVEPVLGFVPSLLVGAVGTAAALAFAATLPQAEAARGRLGVPGALATVLVGFLLLATRRKAITQVVGYLVLENGVFLMGVTLLHAMPLLVELGVLLDLFVGVFILGIIIHHINRVFADLDTARIAAIQD